MYLTNIPTKRSFGTVGEQDPGRTLSPSGSLFGSLAWSEDSLGLADDRIVKAECLRRMGLKAANLRLLNVSVLPRRCLRRMIHSDGSIWIWHQSGAKGRSRSRCFDVVDQSETEILCDHRRRIAGEDAARGGLMFVGSLCPCS